MTEPKLEKMGLGTWAFGGGAYGPMDDDVARSVARRAYDLGVRFFDTAHLYSGGRSEELLGETIGHLPDAKICTKLGYEVVGGKAVKNYNSEYLDRSLALSLKRLRRSHVDLLLLHNPSTEILERGDVFRWLEQQEFRGKIVKWGVSLYDSLKDAEISLNSGAQAIEARYSMLRRDIVDSLNVQKWNFQFIARSPLDGGVLSGGHKTKESFAKTDQRASWPSNTFSVYNELAERLKILVDGGMAASVTELALRFSAFASNVALVIPGAKSIEQLEANINAVRKGPLPEEAIAEINRLRAAFLPKL
jgi:aryl-alcohol dehydrogenase-like predicted oxidoreductase